GRAGRCATTRSSRRPTGRASPWSSPEFAISGTRVVIIGAGGREHAIVRSLRRSGAELVVVPGNAGIAREARCVPAQPSLADAALAERPDLVVVGPEAPLAEGFADRMARQGVPCFGPSKAAAQIEAS